MPAAGRLRHLLVFQESTKTDLGGGNTSTEYTDTDLKLWGAVEGLSASERIVAMQTEGEVSHRITVRYSAAIHSKMRVRDGTKVYDIDPPVDPDGRRRELQMTAREVTG